MLGCRAHPVNESGQHLPSAPSASQLKVELCLYNECDINASKVTCSAPFTAEMDDLPVSHSKSSVGAAIKLQTGTKSIGLLAELQVGRRGGPRWALASCLQHPALYMCEHRAGVCGNVGEHHTAAAEAARRAQGGEAARGRGVRVFCCARRVLRSRASLKAHDRAAWHCICGPPPTCPTPPYPPSPPSSCGSSSMRRRSMARLGSCCSSLSRARCRSCRRGCVPCLRITRRASACGDSGSGTAGHPRKHWPRDGHHRCVVELNGLCIHARCTRPCALVQHAARAHAAPAMQLAADTAPHALLHRSSRRSCGATRRAAPSWSGCGSSRTSRAGSCRTLWQRPGPAGAAAAASCRRRRRPYSYN